MNIEKYRPSVRVIHWITYILLSVVFVSGIVMVEFKEAEPWSMYTFHESIGMLIFGLVLIRIVVRKFTKTPAALPSTSSVEQNVAKLVIILQYFFMLVIPIIGYIQANVLGYDVFIFGLQLPNFFSANPNMENLFVLLHFYAAYVFLGVIALHIFATIKHHIYGNEVLRKIT